jgi:hypothetical protein
MHLIKHPLHIPEPSSVLSSPLRRRASARELGLGTPRVPPVPASMGADSDDEDLVIYGTPIEREEDTSARKRRAVAEASQLRALPAWKQEVLLSPSLSRYLYVPLRWGRGVWSVMLSYLLAFSACRAIGLAVWLWSRGNSTFKVWRGCCRHCPFDPMLLFHYAG